MNLWERIKNNKFVLGFLAFDLLAIIILVLLSFINSFRTATVVISVVPVDATVTINGKTYENSRSYKIFPKKNATITVSSGSLETKTFQLDLPGHEVNSIHTYLNNEKENFAYYLEEENSNDLEQLINLSSQLKDDKKLQAFVKKATILNKLPLLYEDYRDNYAYYVNFTINRYTGTKKCKNDICLSVTTRGEKIISDSELIDLVRQTLTENGCTYEDFEFFYKNEPFSARGE